MALDTGKELVLVKIGGAALTHKQHRGSVQHDVIRWISDVYAPALLRLSHRAVLVHGVGSFGHFEAHEYGVAAGSASGWSSKLQYGFAATLAATQTLHTQVVAALVKGGLPAVSVPSLGLVDPDGDASRLVAVVSDLLHAGLTPVLHGDPVLHATRTTCVVGGDQLLEILAAAFGGDNADRHSRWRVARTVFLMDVDGVYDAPPDTSNIASLIPLISVDGDRPASSASAGGAIGDNEADDHLAMRIATSTLSHDVTGGIIGKLDAAVRIARRGVDVWCVRVASDAALDALSLASCPRTGTLIQSSARQRTPSY